jgi:hypothetical protein
MEAANTFIKFMMIYETARNDIAEGSGFHNYKFQANELSFCFRKNWENVLAKLTTVSFLRSTLSYLTRYVSFFLFLFSLAANRFLPIYMNTDTIVDRRSTPCLMRKLGTGKAVLPLHLRFHVAVLS